MKHLFIRSMSKKMCKLNNTSKPARMWIDGKCFNIKQHKWNKKESRKDVNDQSAIAVEIIDDNINHHFDITPHESGKLMTSFRLPSIYYCKINTHQSFKLQNLETETSTVISMPKYGEDGHLTIIGEDELKIVEARHKVHSVVSDIRDSYAAVQFVCVPVLSDEIKENFENFKNDILNGEPIKGMEESIFQSPLKLHLTVVVFALLDDSEKQEAIRALNDYKTLILDPLIEKEGPLKIEVSGIDCMNNNHKSVDVLYAKAKIINENENTSLQKIINGLSDHFYERGLVRKYQDDVKLHVTLINTKYRKPSNESTPQKRRKWVKRQSFDARSIMQKYKDYYFGTCNFDSIHLSLITTKGDDGFYKAISVIKAN